MRNLIIFIAFIACRSVFGQTYAEDCQKISQKVTNTINLSFKISYRLYDTYADETPRQVSLADFQKSSEGQYFRIGSSVMVTTSQSTLMLNEDEKEIIIAPRLKIEDFQATAAITKDFSGMCSSIMPLASGDLKGYRLMIKKNVAFEYDQIDYYFNPKTHLPQKIVFYYRSTMALDDAQPDKLTRPRLEMHFEDYDQQSEPLRTIFDDRTYYVQKSGKVFPAAIYSGYKVINKK